MSTNIVTLGTPIFQAFIPGTSSPLVGGRLFTYAPGGSTPINSYSTVIDAENMTNPHTNPVILDSNGSAPIVLTGPTKLVLQDSNGNQIYVFDNYNITGSNIYDDNGNALLLFNSQNNAQNEITISNAVSGSPPTIAATGSDTNVGLNINLQGNSTLTLNTGTSGTTAIQGAATIGNTLTVGSTLNAVGNITTNANLGANGSLSFSNSSGATINNNGSGVIGLGGANGNVNYVGIFNAATTVSPIIEALGSDANIVLALNGRGNGGVTVQGSKSGTVPAAGYIGEYVSSLLNSVAISSGVVTNIAAITLQPGRWLIWGSLVMNTTGGQTTTVATINTTSASYNYASFTGGAGNAATASGSGSIASPEIYNITIATTFYLNGFTVYAGSGTAYANISAIRFA